MTDNELIEYLNGQRKHLRAKNDKHRNNLRRVVLGGDEPTLFEEVRIFIIPSNIEEIKEEMKTRGMEIPAEQ